ncbi:MAG: carbohydrate-binding domain-containing protein [Anaerolineae bacterium]|nr:carbohydrate-binding domain-containing protein [Anaerolineae bacterium]
MNIQKHTRFIALSFLMLSLILSACSTTAAQPISETTFTQLTDSVSVAATQGETTTAAISAETDTMSASSQATASQITAISADVAALTESDQTELRNDGSATHITLNGANVAVVGNGVSVNDSVVTITNGGTYVLQGTFSEGQIVVASEDDTPVYLVFDGVNLSNSTTAPLFISQAEEVIIELNAGSENVVTDGANYVFPDAETDEPNAAVFSKDDLTITGSGSLTVYGNYNDGIASKDGLFIAGGTITVNAIDDGIRGKDFVVISGGDVTVNAQGTGIKADNEDDVSLGYVYIEDGTLVLTTGGKGVNGANLVTVDGGTIVANSADDTIHSNGNIVINGGSLTLATNDDGIHADSSITINGGTIDIVQSYEGIESALITLNGGIVSVVSSDDATNVTDGSGSGGGPGGGPGGGRPGEQQTTAYTGNLFLIINGGTLIVNAGGDGLDSNGAIEMNGGLVIVNGPTEQMNGALDYNGTFAMNGGYLVAVGSSGMAEAPSTISTQNALLVNFDQTLPAGTLVHIESADGSDLLTFASSKAFQSVVFSSPDLAQGATYTISYGGTANGDALTGLYQPTDYQGGTQFVQLTLSDSITTYGARGGRRP